MSDKGKELSIEEKKARELKEKKRQWEKRTAGGPASPNAPREVRTK